jgi:hypothetical protein
MIFGMTTTYDDADLFSDSFTDFREVAPSNRHSRVLTVLALVGAALVVVGALVWVRLGQDTPAAQAVDAATLVPSLGQSQGSSDMISDSDRSDLLLYPESTRLLLTDESGSYFVATAPGDQLCLVSVPVGDLAQTACHSTAGDPVDLRIDDVMLVPAGASVPDGWQQAGANVFVRS